MRRQDLVGKLEKMGCFLIRHGGNHDWYQNPRTKVSLQSPLVVAKLVKWLESAEIPGLVGYHIKIRKWRDVAKVVRLM